MEHELECLIHVYCLKQAMKLREKGGGAVFMEI